MTDKPKILLVGPAGPTAETVLALVKAGVEPGTVVVGEEADRVLAELQKESPRLELPDLPSGLLRPSQRAAPAPVPTWHEGENRAQRRRRQRLERKGIVNVSAIARSIGPDGCARDDDESNHHADDIGTDEDR